MIIKNSAEYKKCLEDRERGEKLLVFVEETQPGVFSYNFNYENELGQKLSKFLLQNGVKKIEIENFIFTKRIHGETATAEFIPIKDLGFVGKFVDIGQLDFVCAVHTIFGILAPI